MLLVQTNEKKLNVTFTIDKNLYEQFKKVAQKDMRKYSNIIEGSIRRYVQSKLKKISSKLGFGETASIRINLDDYKTLVDNNSEQKITNVKHR